MAGLITSKTGQRNETNSLGHITEIKAGNTANVGVANRWGCYPSLWEEDDFSSLFLLRNSSSTPHRTSLQCYSMGCLPLLRAAKQLQENKRRQQVPWRCKELVAAVEVPLHSTSKLSREGCKGPRDPKMLCLKVEKEVVVVSLERLCPGCGKKVKKGKGWREQVNEAEAAVITSTGNWRSHIWEHFY